MQKLKISKFYSFVFLILISLVACDNDKDEKNNNSNTTQTKSPSNKKTDKDYLELALDYDFGRGVKQDYAKAITYYEKAAELGNDTAMNNLGRRYNNGIGVKQDYKKAEEFFIKAANTKPSPTPFGIAISKMTLEEFLNKYEAKYIGNDEYTNGKKYIATNLTQFNFNGLKAFTVIFENDVVNAITAEFYKNDNTFDYLYNNLNEKDYYKITSKIPYVGDQYAKFISGGVFIELIAKHLSGTVYLVYETQAYSLQKSTNIMSKKLKQLEHEKDSL